MIDVQMSAELVRQRSKRKVITLDMKIRILDKLKSGEGSTAVAKYFSLNESTVRTIKKNEESIRSSVLAGTSLSSKHTSRARDESMQAMEQELMLWIKDSIQRRLPIDSAVIRRKAVDIFSQIKQENQQLSPNQKLEFLGSKGWFEKFKRRHSLYNFKIKEETESTDDDVGTEGIPDIMLAEVTEFITMKDELTSSVDDSTTNVVESDGDDHISSFTADILSEGLDMVRNLENYFLDHDPNMDRSLKFQRELQLCVAQYQKIYNDILSQENKSSIVEDCYGKSNEFEVPIKKEIH